MKNDSDNGDVYDNILKVLSSGEGVNQELENALEFQIGVNEELKDQIKKDRFEVSKWSLIVIIGLFALNFGIIVAIATYSFNKLDKLQTMIYEVGQRVTIIETKQSLLNTTHQNQTVTRKELKDKEAQKEE